MNWVGGSRSRIKLQNDKKIQKEFFERQRFLAKHKALGGQQGQQRGRHSQDLMALKVVSRTCSNPITGIDHVDSGGKKAERSVRKLDLNKFRTSERTFSEVEMPFSLSPGCATSRISLHEAQHERKDVSGDEKTLKHGEMSARLFTPIQPNYDGQKKLNSPYSTQKRNSHYQSDFVGTNVSKKALSRPYQQLHTITEEPQSLKHGNLGFTLEEFHPTPLKQYCLSPHASPMIKRTEDDNQIVPFSAQKVTPSPHAEILGKHKTIPGYTPSIKTPKLSEDVEDQFEGKWINYNPRSEIARQSPSSLPSGMPMPPRSINWRGSSVMSSVKGGKKSQNQSYTKRMTSPYGRISPLKESPSSFLQHHFVNLSKNSPEEESIEYEKVKERNSLGDTSLVDKRERDAALPTERFQNENSYKYNSKNDRDNLINGTEPDTVDFWRRPPRSCSTASNSRGPSPGCKQVDNSSSDAEGKKVFQSEMSFLQTFESIKNSSSNRFAVENREIDEVFSEMEQLETQQSLDSYISQKVDDEIELDKMTEVDYYLSTCMSPESKSDFALSDNQDKNVRKKEISQESTESFETACDESQDKELSEVNFTDKNMFEDSRNMGSQSTLDEDSLHIQNDLNQNIEHQFTVEDNSVLYIQNDLNKNINPHFTMEENSVRIQSEFNQNIERQFTVEDNSVLIQTDMPAHCDVATSTVTEYSDASTQWDSADFLQLEAEIRNYDNDPKECLLLLDKVKSPERTSDYTNCQSSNSESADSKLYSLRSRAKNIHEP